MSKLKILLLMNRLGTMENFSIPILSALARKEGHDTKLMTADKDQRTLAKEASGYRPDIIAYSICSNEAAEYLDINRSLKNELSFFSLFGGPHPTFFPSFISNDSVDAICRGEADISFPKFLNNFGKDDMYNTANFSFNVKGKITENPLCDLVPDLDTLPYPHRDIIYSKSYFMAKNPVKTFMASRGCPYNCSYCFNHIYNAMYKNKGRIMRVKSVSYLIEEIRRVKERYPLAFIKFHDDIFGADPAWLEEFAERYPKECGIPFLCLSRPNMINDKYCELLKKSGCNSLEMAVESGSESIRNEILNRNVKNEQIVKACASLKKFGIRIYTLNMVGLPTESYDDMMATVKLNRDTKVDFTDTSIFQPYPGTDLSRYCVEKGFLKNDRETFQSQFSSSILEYDEEFKTKIYVLHRLFAVLVDYPGLSALLPLLFRLGRYSLVRYVLNMFYRFYYGYNLHKRIFASKIPLYLRLYGGVVTVFSKNRV